MSFMPMGSYIEGDSLIHKMNAFIKLLCLLASFVAIIFSDTLISYIVVILLLAVIVKLSSIGIKRALSGVKYMWLFFIIIFLMNAAFFETEEALWSWWIFNVSVGGIVQGANVVLRVALAMIFGNVFLSTTSPLDIIYAIEKLIYPLKFIGVPIHDVAMVLGVAIQFIPIFIYEAAMIKKAQTARGARFESKKFRHRAQSVIPLVVPIFLSAFRRADELSVAMEARGYRGGKKKIK